MSGIAWITRLVRSPGVAAIRPTAQSIEPGAVKLHRDDGSKVVPGGCNHVGGGVAAPRRPAEERAVAVEDEVAILECDPNTSRVVEIADTSIALYRMGVGSGKREPRGGCTTNPW